MAGDTLARLGFGLRRLRLGGCRAGLPCQRRPAVHAEGRARFDSAITTRTDAASCLNGGGDHGLDRRTTLRAELLPGNIIPTRCTRCHSFLYSFIDTLFCSSYYFKSSIAYQQCSIEWLVCLTKHLVSSSHCSRESATYSRPDSCASHISTVNSWPVAAWRRKRGSRTEARQFASLPRRIYDPSFVFAREGVINPYTHSFRELAPLMPRSFMRATTSSWRTRSREMPSSLPTSSRVRLRPSPMP